MFWLRLFALSALPWTMAAHLAQAADQVPFIQVSINDNKAPLGKDQKLTVPYNASQLRFLITPVPGIVRYRLLESRDWEQRKHWLFAGDTYVNQDRSWQTRAGAMYVGIRFYAKDGDFVDEIRFNACGKSSGWKGSLGVSQFTLRQETLQVPAGAERVEVFTTSAGPPTSVGILAIADYSLRAGNRLVEIQSGWKKEGSKPSMAFEQRVGGHLALVIDDTDIRAHADWVSPRREVAPHEALTLTWEEIYSNGMGDPLTAVYGTLPVGDYRFVAEEIDLAGSPKRSCTIELTVAPPFWRTAWFWTAGLGIAAVLGMSGGLLLSRAANRKREEAQQLLEEERHRIARDLHDDLGAQLSQMILASSFAANAARDDQSRQSFRSMNGLAHSISASLSKTIWMLNPDNDNLESLADFLGRMVGAQCKSAEVKVRFNISQMPGSMSVSNEFRHNVTLAVREAVTNALRHANPSEVWLVMNTSDGWLQIEVKDDGAGYPADPRKGNGLVNMKQRAAKLGGVCEIISHADAGTRVQFAFPIAILTPQR